MLRAHLCGDWIFEVLSLSNSIGSLSKWLSRLCLEFVPSWQKASVSSFSSQVKRLVEKHARQQPRSCVGISSADLQGCAALWQ